MVSSAWIGEMEGVYFSREREREGKDLSVSRGKRGC